RRNELANPQLNGKRIAALVDNGFEQVELTGPKGSFEKAGAQVDVISPQSGRVKGWQHTDWGDEVTVDRPLAAAKADDYDGLLKPIAAICHGPWTLIEAGAVRGRRMTSWPSLKTDLTNAGATWVDEQVVVDNGLVTSRKPDDIPAFSQKAIE